MTYQVLHYPGDVTGWEDAQPGALLGTDEFHRPYEVIDAEYEPDVAHVQDFEGNVIRTDPVGPGRTTVHLQYATPETLRAHLANLPGVFQAGGVR